MYLGGNRPWVSLIVKQNSTLVNFPPESRLPFALIITFTEKGRQKAETGIKEGWKKWNTNFCL